MNQLTTQFDDAARVFKVTGECQAASRFLKAGAQGEPSEHSWKEYQKHLVQASALALDIKDEFYKGLAIRKVISVCKSAREFDVAKALFREVAHHSLREQIAKDAPELAGERKSSLTDDTLLVPTTIVVDGLERGTIVNLVAKVMRDSGYTERDIDGFRQDAREADFDRTLATALDWGAPIKFKREGKSWIKGDKRRLSCWQKIKRFLALRRGSYVHPDGTIELGNHSGA